MDIDSAVDLIEQAERSAVGIEAFSGAPGGLTADQAWAIARERDVRRSNAGLHHSGYKLGWTSLAMRRAIGIDSPNYGSLWAEMQIHDELDLDSYIHPKAEPEIAFRADMSLAGPDLTPHEVSSSGSWAAALEVVDPRWTTYDFTWEDNTADGSSAAGYVIGPWQRPLTDPADWSVTMSFARVRRDGRGCAAMGSPAVAVSWLVRSLHEVGAYLRPGMIVLTGGLTEPVDLTPRLTVEVSSPELGSCTLTCNDQSKPF